LAVRPLDSALKLIEESLAQRNCVGAYSQPAFENAFVFAVCYHPPAPETRVYRMTCALELEPAVDAKGEMRLTMVQCRLRNKREPPADVVNKVLALERNVNCEVSWVHAVLSNAQHF